MTHKLIKHEPRWVALRRGKIQGPFCEAEVVAKLGSQQLDRGDALWRPAFTRWQSVADFMQALPSATRQKIYRALQQRQRQHAWQQAQLKRQQVLRQARQLAVTARHAKAQAHARRLFVADRPPEATGPDAVAARLRRCAMPKLSIK